MFQDKTEIAAGERLRQSNYNLKSTVQELRLEIAYYQGEAKRLEWEKNGLKQDVGKMSALFKGWLNELQCSNTRNIVDETDYFKNLIANPSKNISEILQSKDIKLLLTSCQAPFYVEYTNQAWTLECGWDSHEILGLTCAFMQGELTHLKTAADYTRSMRELGYANMRINNYRKNGTVFNVSITSFPVYDSISAVGLGCDVPILTHFATILSDIRNLTAADISIMADSVTQILEENIIPRRIDQYPQSSSFSTTSSALTSSSASSDSSSCLENLSVQNYDRRVRCKKFSPECHLTSEIFLKTAESIRLSDLLRLMLSCTDAMVLTDKAGKIVHCNRSWVKLTGHTLNDAEGLHWNILHGSMTDSSEIRRCSTLHKASLPSVSTVINYRKDGLMFTNSVTISPIRGVYMSEDVSHFCALQLPQSSVNVMGSSICLNVDTRSSSSRNIKRARQSLSSESDEESDNDDKFDVEESLDSIGEYLTTEIGLERVMNKIYPGVKSVSCSSASQSSKEVQIYPSSGGDNTFGDFISQSNSASTSRALPGRIRNISSEKLHGQSVGHNAKNGGKHLRIQSSVVSHENEGNSTVDSSPNNGSCVDSPITDGTNTP